MIMENSIFLKMKKGFCLNEVVFKNIIYLQLVYCRIFYFFYFWPYVRQVEPHWCPLHQFILLTKGPICEIFENLWIENLSFFESVIFYFFCFIPIQISHNLWGTKDVTKFWWLLWFPAKSYLGGCKIMRHCTYMRVRSWDREGK